MKFEIFQTQNRRTNIISRKSHRKVSKLKQTFSPILGQLLNRALNNLAYRKHETTPPLPQEAVL